MAQPAPGAQAVVRSPISPVFVKALCYASKIQNSENGGDKFCFPEESVALILKLDDPAPLRPLVTNGNGLVEGEDYKIGGPAVIQLIDPKKKNRVLSRLTNSSRLLFSFDGVMKMLALVHDNPVAARVRSFLVETLKKDIDLITKKHNKELRLRAEGERARALVKKTSEETFNPLVEMGGKRFATIELGGEFKRNLVGLKNTAVRAAFKQHSGVDHKSYKSTLNLTGAALQALHSSMAYNFKADGKSNEETLHLTTHFMMRVQRSVNCNRVLTPEEQMKFMTAPTAKKRQQNAITGEPANQRPKTRTARKLPITGTPMVRAEETQYETADEGDN